MKKIFSLSTFRLSIYNIQRSVRIYYYEYICTSVDYVSMCTSMCCIDSNGETSRIVASLYRVGLNACVHYWRQFYICFLFIPFSLSCPVRGTVFEDSFLLWLNRDLLHLLIVWQWQFDRSARRAAESREKESLFLHFLSSEMWLLILWLSNYLICIFTEFLCGFK